MHSGGCEADVAIYHTLQITHTILECGSAIRAVDADDGQLNDV
jgi:hypothetical protein